jgi:hypothetical protein
MVNFNSNNFTNNQCIAPVVNNLQTNMIKILSSIKSHNNNFKDTLNKKGRYR